MKHDNAITLSFVHLPKTKMCLPQSEYFREIFICVMWSKTSLMCHKLFKIPIRITELTLEIINKCTSVYDFERRKFLLWTLKAFPDLLIFELFDYILMGGFLKHFLIITVQHFI